MKVPFDVQKSRFRVRVDQMLFDFDFGPVNRLTGVTAGRSHRHWCFRFIGCSRTLIVYADVADGATTSTVFDATATARDATTTATGSDATATATAGDAYSTACDATATAGNTIATASNATATAGDANAATADATATFRHRHLLL
jgi:hypothetical protein